MYSIGQQLKQARKRLGMSLEELEKRSKVEGAYLRALENDQYQLIGNPVYVRAYIRSYAKEVGLPSQPLISQYDSLMGQVTTPGSMMNNQTTINNQPRKNLRHTMSTQPSRGTQVSARRPLEDGRAQKTMVNMPPTYPPSSETRKQSLDELYQTTAHLTQKIKPRKVAMVAKEGVKLAKNQLARQKRNKYIWLAVTSILILFGGIYYFLQSDEEVPVNNGNESATSRMQTPVTVLEQGEANDELGHMYYITNVSKLEVIFQGKKEPTRLRYGTSKDQYSEKVLQEGEVFKMDTDQKDEAWFWLEIPSNITVTINGQVLDTSAQDVQKSYRVQIKK
jgi:cytoskeleton protein RodZ